MTGPSPGAVPGEAAPAHPSSLRANRDFVAVLAGQAVSAFGDAVTLTAMPLLVLFLTGSAALMGVVGALQFLPDLVIGLPAGALADRLDRRRMMFWADAGRACLAALIPVSFWLDGPTMAVILLVTVPLNALRVLSDAAFSSSIPGLVGREHLGRANSILEATLSIPFIVGPAMAGILVATIGAATTIAIDALTFAVSAASLLFVRRSLRAVRSAEPTSWLADIREGVTWIVRNRVVRAAIAYWGVLQVSTAALIPALGYLVTIDRGFGPELFGFVGSAWSIGYLAGSLAAGRLPPTRLGRQLLGAGLVVGISVVALARFATPAAMLVSGFFVGAGLAVVLVSYATLRASATPDELLGRVGSSARVVTLGLQPLGLLVAGVVIEGTDAATAMLAMGVTVAVASLLFGVVGPLRSAEGPAPGTTAA